MASTAFIKNSLFRDATNDLSLDYGSVLSSISNFRRSNGKDSTISFDGPQTYYFKIMFFFDDGKPDAQTSDSGIPLSNLLGLSYDGTIFENGLPWNGGRVNKLKEKNNYKSVNTALNYLMLNYEWERAQKLIDFIDLLSEISSKYPWYFQSITGLDNAITRKEFTDKDFKIGEERKNFQIKCLPDSEDNKIGKLLDLYRDVTYSQLMKKEILPSNLRKFDMGIFIFSRPIKNIHRKVSGKTLLNNASNGENWDASKDLNDTARKTGSNNIYANFKPELDLKIAGKDTSEYKTSYKYIEFHNCEIDYNSSASAYGDLNNAEGFKQEYTITINYDDAFENRYDETFLKNIGDFCIWDLNLNSSKQSRYTTNSEGDVNASNSDDTDEAAFWNELLGVENEWRTTHQDEFDVRKSLLKYDDANEESKNKSTSATVKDLKTVGGVGINASDLVPKKNTGNIRALWKGTLATNSGSVVAKAVNQVYNYVDKKYIAPEIKKYKKLILGNFYVSQYKKLSSGLKALSNGNVFTAYNKLNSFKNGWKKS